MKFILFFGLYWGVLGFTAPQMAPRRLSLQLFSAPEPLASEGDWAAFLDKDNTGLVYYFNLKTGESLWEPPTKSFPMIQLDSETRELAEAQRLDYVRRMREQEKGKEEKKEGILSKLLERPKEEEKLAEEPPAKQEPLVVVEEPEDDETKKGWFDILFEKTEDEVIEEVPVVEEQAESPLDFIGNLFSAPPTEPAPVAKPASTVKERVVKLDMAAYILPHPAKQLWGGEDATFTKGRTFGVFDGVSGAFKLDGVPLYSKTLATELKRRVGMEALSMKDMQKTLLDAAVKADSSATGASTAIMASIDESGFLRVLNVGDSTCMVVRGDKIVTRSREISHYFDCPYQLSADSPDRPRDGTKMNIELMSGDLVVMGSDGVFDNLDDAKLIETIKSAPPRPSAIAKRLSDQSRKVSMSKTEPTPYAKAAKRNGDPDYAGGVGGKVDDISCVVARYER